jgi:predicted phosphodiesterase
MSVLKGKYKSILFISDMHFPYNHPDVVAFLKALKTKYKPDLVVCLGDELDFHAISFHDHDGDLLSPGDELKTSIARLQPIYKMFPKMHLVESNHGSLVYRKGKANGLPKSVLKSYRDVLEAPQGWHWHDDLIVYASDGMPIYVCHGKTSDAIKLSQSMGMSTINGHFHEKFEIRYWGNKMGLYWSVIAGCLIENNSLAFAYNKLNLKRPLIGTAVVIEGQPKLCPMILNSQGRWIKKII